MRTQALIRTFPLTCLIIGGPSLTTLLALEPVQPDNEQAWDLKHYLPKDFSVKPVYFPTYTTSPGNLLGDGVQRDAFDLQMKSSIPGGLMGEAQVGQSVALSQTDRLFQNQKNQLMRFKVAGNAGFIQYGSEYRSVGQGYRPQPGAATYRLDQEATESWVEHKFSSWFSIKGLHSEYTNNVAMDPNRPRTTTSLNGAETTFMIPSGPSLTLSYMTGTAETKRLNMPGQAQESMVDQYSASLDYRHEWWDVSLSSSMVASRNKAASDQQMENAYHALSVSFRPNDHVWISPSVSYGQDRYKWNGERVTYPMTSLSMLWSSLFGLVDFSSYTSYMGMKSTAGSADNIAIYSISSFIYNLGPIKNERYLSFDIIHNSYNDNIYRRYSTDENTIRLVYNVKRF